MSVLGILVSLIGYYEILIVVYILMSWLRPSTGIIFDIYHALGTIVEPWLGLFRRIVPPIGMIDISPIVAIIALQVIERLLSSLLFRFLG